MSEIVPTRYGLRVKQRRRVVDYAETYGVRPASRHFGLSRITVKAWISRNTR